MIEQPAACRQHRLAGFLGLLLCLFKETKLKSRYCFIIFLAFICSVLFAQPAQEKEAPKPTTRILFVLDASQSMIGRWQSDLKMNIAKKLLSNLTDSLKGIDHLQVALRVYGHQKNYPPQDCDDTRLEVPFSNFNYDRIKHKLQTLKPSGTTPIALSLEQAANDFPPCDNCRNIIILITDGIEECAGDPCAVSRALQKKGIVLKPFIIGIGKDFSDAFKCVGTYFDAADEKMFRTALNVVISQALNSTTLQVNLLDDSGEPTETNVNMTFYDNFSGKPMYNYIHTLNHKGVPDTLTIDPLLMYNAVVHTIPPVRIDSISLIPGKHTTVATDAAQGHLQLKSGGNPAQTRSMQCIVRKAGEMNTTHVQYMNTTEKYLTGLYDIEFLCLPRFIQDQVSISQSHTTTIEIPGPGIAVIQKNSEGFGSIYVERGDTLEWIYNLQQNSNTESLVLQPGHYRVVFRSRYLNKSLYTVEKRFSVQSGSTINVNISR